MLIIEEYFFTKNDKIIFKEAVDKNTDYSPIENLLEIKEGRVKDVETMIVFYDEFNPDKRVHMTGRVFDNWGWIVSALDHVLESNIDYEIYTDDGQTGIFFCPSERGMIKIVEENKTQLYLKTTEFCSAVKEAMIKLCDLTEDKLYPNLYRERAGVLWIIEDFKKLY